MAGPRIHDTKTALKSRRAIKGAAPGRRAAFAIGMFGGSAVMLARRGKPASVLSALRTMAPPETAPAADRKMSFKVATSGLLFRDGEELVLQCRERPDATRIAKARKYFKLLKAGTPWSKVRVTRLHDADEGDPGADAEDEAEDDLGHEAADETADEAAEDQIVDAWDDEPLPPAGSSPPGEPPAAPDMAQQAPDGLAPPHDPAAQEAVEAARVTRLVATMAPRLLGAGITQEALQGTIADMLRVMSADRLLLALCSATNMEHLAGAARDAAAEAAEPGATEPPLANDESGHDRIGRAMATLGERIGRERGLVAPGESATAGAFILGMVRQLWSRNTQRAPEEVIAQLSAVLVGVFGTKGGKDLRAMLGMPGTIPTDARPDAAGEAAPWRRSLADARGGWAAAVPGAITSVARIKDVIRDTYADEDDVDINAALAMLDGVVSRLDDGLVDRLDGLLGETQGDRLASRRQGVEQAVAAMRTYLETDEVASSLDGNDFVEGTSVVAVLVGHLAVMQASLAQANAG